MEFPVEGQKKQRPTRLARPPCRYAVPGDLRLHFEAIGPPAALRPGAVALGQPVTGRTPFGNLDRVDQIGLLQFTRLDAQPLGLRFDLGHRHTFAHHAR